MHAERIAAHIATLRELLTAQRALDRAREANSTLLPRRGPRGGRATTLEARHSTAAEYRDRIEAKAEAESYELFGCRCERKEVA